MTLPLHHLLLEVRTAVAIWFVIVGLGLASCTFLFVPAAREWYRRHRGRVARVRAHRAALVAEADELNRYAEQAAAAAADAELIARRRQAEWEAVHRAREEAWHAYLAADTRAGRLMPAAAFPVPDGVHVAEGGTYLRRVATQAYRKGDLSVAQLTEILPHGRSWYPHPADQEIALRRIARQRRRDAYLTVTELELTARRTADIAFVTRDTLRHEALAAAVRAQRFEDGLARRSGPARVRRPSGGEVGVPATGAPVSRFPPDRWSGARSV
jgi:hypothetical protein